MTATATKTRRKAKPDVIAQAVTGKAPPLKGRDPKAQLEDAKKQARKDKAKLNRDKHELGFLKAFEPFAEKYGFPTPERNFKFSASRRWQLDFAWPHARGAKSGKYLMLAIEIQGATTFRGAKGGHATADGMQNDAEKLNAAQAAGWTVLYFTERTPYESMAKQVADYFLKNA